MARDLLQRIDPNDFVLLLAAIIGLTNSFLVGRMQLYQHYSLAQASLLIACRLAVCEL